MGPMPGSWNDSWDRPALRSRPPTDDGLITAQESSSNSLPSESQTHRPSPPACVGDSSNKAVRETTEHPIVIAVFGQTGTGKTAFIQAAAGKNLAVGHDLTSCTRDVLEVPCTIEGQDVVLVDTPGFSDTHRTDTEILQVIAEWMHHTYNEGALLSGIIYFHRIVDVRMEGPGLKNLRMMKKLCGSQTLRNVVLATTMWENVSIEAGERRETELKLTFWKDMLDEGAGIARLMNQSGDEARSLVRAIMKNTPKSTMLQDQLHEGLSLVQTAAGQAIKQGIANLEQKLRAKYQEALNELEAAQLDHNRQLEEDLRAENDQIWRKIEAVEAEKQELEQTRLRTWPVVKRSGIFGFGSYYCHVCHRAKTKQVGLWICTQCGHRQRNAW